MGTEIFKKIAAWHRENRKYDGFIQFESFGLLTVFLLVTNLCFLSTNPVDWLIVLLDLVVTLFYVERWMGEMKFDAFRDFTREIMEADHSLTDAVMARCEAEHRWLVSANRRRKRAERKLKNTRLALRKESAERLGFEVKCDEYESVLLDANLAMADIGSCPILPDTAAMAEAQQRFKAYMKIHYAEIAKRQLNRELKESSFGCLFFGDAKHNVKETYAGLYGSKEFSQQLFSDTIKDANACLGALLGIKPEDEQPQS